MMKKIMIILLVMISITACGVFGGIDAGDIGSASVDISDDENKSNNNDNNNDANLNDANNVVTITPYPIVTYGRGKYTPTLVSKNPTVDADGNTAVFPEPSGDDKGKYIVPTTVPVIERHNIPANISPVVFISVVSRNSQVALSIVSGQPLLVSVSSPDNGVYSGSTVNADNNIAISDVVSINDSVVFRYWGYGASEPPSNGDEVVLEINHFNSETPRQITLKFED